MWCSKWGDYINRGNTHPYCPNVGSRVGVRAGPKNTDLSPSVNARHGSNRRGAFRFQRQNGPVVPNPVV
jgi:hypothetical protein